MRTDVGEWKETTNIPQCSCKGRPNETESDGCTSINEEVVQPGIDRRNDHHDARRYSEQA